MSDDNDVIESKASGNSSAMPTIVYVLYLVALVTGLPMLIGVLFSYLATPNNEVERNHYRYQIRTFWLAVIYMIIGGLTVPLLGLGFLVMLFGWIFVLVRSLKGLSAYDKQKEIPNVTTWFW